MHWHKTQRRVTSNYGQGRLEWVFTDVRVKEKWTIDWGKEIRGVFHKERSLYEESNQETGTKDCCKMKVILVVVLYFVGKAMREKFWKVSRIHIAQVWSDVRLCPKNNGESIIDSKQVYVLQFTQVPMKKVNLEKRRNRKIDVMIHIWVCAHGLANMEITKLNNKHASLCWGLGIQEQLIWRLWLRASQRVNKSGLWKLDQGLVICFQSDQLAWLLAGGLHSAPCGTLPTVT